MLLTFIFCFALFQKDMFLYISLAVLKFSSVDQAGLILKRSMPLCLWVLGLQVCTSPLPNESQFLYMFGIILVILSSSPHTVLTTYTVAHNQLQL